MTTADQSLLIAVDGGGTGCRVAVGTPQGGILGEAKGGPANVSTNFDNAIANIVAATKAAVQNAGLPEGTIASGTAHLGLAGADLDTVRAKTMAALPFGQICVSGDRQTTVAGVLGGQDGFVVSLGTGTIIARQSGGSVKTVGGWGFQLSDQASGAWLGRMLLTRVIEAAEGLDPHSTLSRTIADQLGGVQGVFKFSTTASPADYAQFAPQIFGAGQTDDPLAVDILTTGAAYIHRGLTALGFKRGDILSLAGGVGPHYAPYLADEFTTNLCAPKGNALQGAFGLARQLAAARKI